MEKMQQVLGFFHLNPLWEPTSLQSLSKNRVHSWMDPELTILAPYCSSVKTLSVPSSRALFLHTDLVPVWSVCGVCLFCRSGTVVKTMLNSECLCERGAKSRSVFMIHLVYVWISTLCACGSVANDKMPARMCRWNRWSVDTCVTSAVDRPKPLVS